MKGGIGLADVENHVLCTSKSRLRIASISKSLTSVAIGKLLEEGLLDLNAPVQKYVPTFPEKSFDGEPVEITTKALLTHTSGIRGYFDDCNKVKNESLDAKGKRKRKIQISKFGKDPVDSDENYFREHYKSVEHGLCLFEHDPIICKPGTEYEYSTLAYSLVSRVIETVSGQDFVPYMNKVCNDMGMRHTRVDLNDPIIYNRARNYQRQENGKLENVPYVDNSYKWAGGGFLSNVEDLIQFGNVMLMSAQTEHGYLKASTISTLWEPNPISLGKVSKNIPEVSMTLGWCILPDKSSQQKLAVYHTGGAVGASSILMIVPEIVSEDCHNSTKYPLSPSVSKPPQGIVIALIVNMQSVSLTDTAVRIRSCLEEKSS